MEKKNLLIFWAAVVTGVFLIACSAGKQMTAQADLPPAPKQVAPETHPEVDFSLSCIECHSTETPDQVEEWSAGMHGQVNVNCFVCHGDGIEEFYPSPTTERCVSCHSRYEVNFSAEKEASSCFSCHDGHTLKFHPSDTPGFGRLFPSQLPRVGKQI